MLLHGVMTRTSRRLTTTPIETDRLRRSRRCISDDSDIAPFGPEADSKGAGAPTPQNCSPRAHCGFCRRCMPRPCAAPAHGAFQHMPLPSSFRRTVTRQRVERGKGGVRPSDNRAATDSNRLGPRRPGQAVYTYIYTYMHTCMHTCVHSYIYGAAELLERAGAMSCWGE